MAHKIEVGMRFNSLVVKSYYKKARGKQRKATSCEVVCDCGKTKEVWASNLISGHTKSCGCDRVKAGQARLKHGHAKELNNVSPTYKSWSSMKWRCGKAAGYEAVTVCERWSEFSNFLADMGERPEGMTLDRIDPYGNYEPSNCRWATLKQQSMNRREWKHSANGLEKLKRNLPNLK